MISKIISGGQTGADQGALDAAIRMGIPHGGWIPRGRLTEDGPLDDQYHLLEMPTEGYPERTEKNIIYSDGTVIISHGKLADGSKLTRKLAEMHSKPCLHIDLDEMLAFIAVTKLHEWLIRQGIGVLNVAGPRASRDPDIYRETRHVIEGVILLGWVKAPPQAMAHDLAIADLPAEPPPGTVGDAVDLLLANIPLKHQVLIANLEKHEFSELYFRLGNHIRRLYGMWSGDEGLAASCCAFSCEDQLDPGVAAAVIMDALWKRLRKMHQLVIDG